MRGMVADGEADHLVAERVWQELRKALQMPRPSAAIALLRDCGALAVLLPEVDALFGIPQRPEYHPEVDTGVHTQMVLDMAATLAPGDALVGFCALTHDLGKALTPRAELPRHVGHEHSGVRPLRALCARYKVPAEYAAMAEIVCREHLNIHRLAELRPETVHDLLARCDGFRKPERIRQLALACEADKRGRLGMQDSAYPAAAQLMALHAAAMTVSAGQAVASGLSGTDVGEWLRKARIEAIAAARG
jgi:tRNA nucleotidyltransferase (CCA-adding enzyme)